ncbi:PepSY domain-containing protein [Asaia bogorensis]|uniref:PepSY-associated TM helix domain-containing protein n=1 Tax=Asaia bogorensis TaxID=91915 RepID=UPI000EFBF34A|nr:PepSY-associated TM helix domain-containing protein [Asaia bogorensis]
MNLDRFLWPLRPTRATLLVLHRYLGLALAPLLVVLGLTGSVSVFRVELDGLLNPDLFTTRHLDNHLPPSSLIKAIETRHPGQSLILLDYRPARFETIHAYLSPREDAPGKPVWDEIFIDPSDGHELGGRLSEGCCLGRRALLPFIYRLHYSLAIGQTGLWIVGLAALIWSLDCLNGLLLTLPPAIAPWRRRFWHGWRKSWMIAAPRNALRLLFDLHRAAGLWLWLLFLGMAISGVALALGPQIFQPVVRTIFPLAPPQPEIPLPGGPRILTIEQAESRAHDWVTTHGWQARPAALMLTHAPDTVMFYLFSETDRFPAGFGSPLVTVDLQSGATKLASMPPHGRLGDMILQIQDPFHSGRIAGLPGRILVCLSGIVTAILAMTGVLIWSGKRRARAQSAAQDVRQKRVLR